MRYKTFSSSQLGVNINIKNIVWLGLDLEKTLDTLFSLGDHVRIPLPFDMVAQQKGTFDFSLLDRIVTKAVQQEKTIHFQLGAKTINYPEVHLPKWLVEQYPYLLQKNTVIDKEPAVQEYILEYLVKCIEHFLPVIRNHIGSVHIENEAHSKRLALTNFRYISQSFNQIETALVRRLIPETIPLVQNFPFDSPREGWTLLKRPDIDIIGLNIYNQAGSMLSQKFPFPYWKGIQLAAASIKKNNKHVYITEYQTASWIDNAKNPLHPFTEKRFFAGLQTLNDYVPDAIIFLWDVEQIVWRGNKKNLTAIKDLSRG